MPIKYFARGLVLILGGFLYLLGRGMLRPHEPDEVALAGGALQIVAILFIFLVWFQWRQTALTAPDWSKHRSILAGVFILFGILTIGALYALLHAMAFSEGQIAEAIKKILQSRFDSFGATLTIAFAMTSVATGVGLYFDKVWARILAKLMALLYALAWPLGLCAAVYTWWVLNPNSSKLPDEQKSNQALDVPSRPLAEAVQHDVYEGKNKDHGFPGVVFVPLVILLAIAVFIKLTSGQNQTSVPNLPRSHQYDDVFRKFWDNTSSEQPPRALREQKSDKLPSPY